MLKMAIAMAPKKEAGLNLQTSKPSDGTEEEKLAQKDDGDEEESMLT